MLDESPYKEAKEAITKALESMARPNLPQLGVGMLYQGSIQKYSKKVDSDGAKANGINQEDLVDQNR